MFDQEQSRQEWAESLSKLLVESKEAVAVARRQGQQTLSQAEGADFALRYDRLLEAGYRANPPPAEPPLKKRGRRKQSKSRNLLGRLRDHKQEVW